MRKVCVSICLSVAVFLFSLIFSSVVTAESGPLTHKPNTGAPPTKADQMRDLLPDLIVSDISEDSLGNIIVKIKNIGRGYIKESNYSSALVELEINKKGSKISLADIDPTKTLYRPGGEVVWNTGKKIYGRTEVIVRVDITNSIKESAETNNQLGKTFTKVAFGGVDLKITDLKKQSNDYSYYAEIENVGNKEFKGTIFLQVWQKNYPKNVWSRVLPPYVFLISSDGIFRSKLNVAHNPIECKNVTIAPHQVFNTLSSSCTSNFLFKLVPEPPDIGVEIKIILETDTLDENKGNNEFIKNITR